MHITLPKRHKTSRTAQSRPRGILRSGAASVGHRLQTFLGFPWGDPTELGLEDF